jgi:hypothetical protein
MGCGDLKEAFRLGSDSSNIGSREKLDRLGFIGQALDFEVFVTFQESFIVSPCLAFNLMSCNG